MGTYKMHIIMWNRINQFASSKETSSLRRGVQKGISFYTTGKWCLAVKWVIFIFLYFLSLKNPHIIFFSLQFEVLFHFRNQNGKQMYTYTCYWHNPLGGSTSKCVLTAGFVNTLVIKANHRTAKAFKKILTGSSNISKQLKKTVLKKKEKNL